MKRILIVLLLGGCNVTGFGTETHSLDATTCVGFYTRESAQSSESINGRASVGSAIVEGPRHCEHDSGGGDVPIVNAGVNDGL